MFNMKTYRRTESQEKIVQNLDLLYEQLIEYKKMKRSELVVLRSNKVVRIKPGSKAKN